MTEKGYSFLQDCISNKENKLLELNTNLYIINIEKVLHSSGLESISLGRAYYDEIEELNDEEIEGWKH